MFSSRRSDPTHSTGSPASRLAVAADRRPAEPTLVRYSLRGARHAVAVRMAITVSAAIVIAGLLPAIASGVAAAAVTHPGHQRVTYLGYSFEVPRGWSVINLTHHRGTCVRFDHHAVYLGTPPRDQGCPSLIVGTTEAMLIQPVSLHGAPVSVKNEVTRRITVIARRIHVTATFDAHPAAIDRILASAGLPPPVTSAADAAAADRASPAAPAQTSAAGQDPLEVQRAARACTSERHELPRARLRHLRCAQRSRMQAWWRHSRYRAVGTTWQLGSSVRAANLTSPGSGTNRGRLAFHSDVRRTAGCLRELSASAARQDPVLKQMLCSSPISLASCP